MQTFLPYSDFFKCAHVLDYRRLGKQRVEAKQILETLQGKSNSWKNHPAVKMWEGYEEALKLYFNYIAHEWCLRGYEHNMGFYKIDYNVVCFPWWLGNEKFHLSHRSNLLRKNPKHYGKYFLDFPPNNLPYYWPVK